MTTHEITLSNGQTVWLTTLSGTVLSVHQSERTSVHQDAPLVLSKDMVIPGQVSSTTRTRLQLWLRMPNGQERAMELVDVQVPVREGHEVSVVTGGRSQTQDQLPFGIRNHTTGEMMCDVTRLGAALRRWKLNIGAGMSLLRWTGVFTIVLGLVGWFNGGRHAPTWAFFGAIGGAVAGFVIWSLVGSNLGPERRAMQMVNEINAWARKALESGET